MSKKYPMDNNSFEARDYTPKFWIEKINTRYILVSDYDMPREIRKAI